MSEMAPERTRTTGNAFSQKIGPLPLWGWMGIGLAVALVFYFWQKNKAGSGNQASNSTENGTTEPADQVPPFIIQNYPGTENAQTVGPVTAPVNPGGPNTPATPPPPPVTPQPTPANVVGTVTVPNLAGQRANFALGNLKSIGLIGEGKTKRNPKDEYTVAGQTPAAGTKVPKGTKVTLTWKRIAGK
jgi:PASTA domain